MTLPKKRGPGRPRDAARAERRREAILDTAALVFARHGYPNTDVQYVADALGLAKGTIYRYFPSKQELFLAAVDRGVRRLWEAVDAAFVEGADPLEQVAACVRAYLRYFQEHPQLVELMMQERAEFR